MSKKKEMEFGDANVLHEHYQPALATLFERIVEKHKEHGTSFLVRSFGWLSKRGFEKMNEYGQAETLEEKIIKALDVAIFWFLMAQKHLLGHEEAFYQDTSITPVTEGHFVTDELIKELAQIRNAHDPEHEWLYLAVLDSKRYPEMVRVIELIQLGIAADGLEEWRQ